MPPLLGLPWRYTSLASGVKDLTSWESWVLTESQSCHSPNTHNLYELLQPRTHYDRILLLLPNEHEGIGDFSDPLLLTFRFPACHQQLATSSIGDFINVCATRTTGRPPAEMCADSLTTPYTCNTDVEEKQVGGSTDAKATLPEDDDTRHACYPHH